MLLIVTIVLTVIITGIAVYYFWDNRPAFGFFILCVMPGIALAIKFGILWPMPVGAAAGLAVCFCARYGLKKSLKDEGLED